MQNRAPIYIIFFGLITLMSVRCDAQKHKAVQIKNNKLLHYIIILLRIVWYGDLLKVLALVQNW